MKDDVQKELTQRGTAEVSNGVVNQITQSLSETDTKAEYIIFGELRKQKIKPLDDCCTKCSFWKNSSSIKACQDNARKDAQARGFYKLVCPYQLED